MSYVLPDMPAPFRYILTLISLGNTPATNKLNFAFSTGEQRLIRQNCHLSGLGICLGDPD